MKVLIRSALFLLLLLFTSTVGLCQLVNIESRRMQTDSVRFALKSDWLFNYASNNGNEVYQVRTNLATQLKSADLNKIWFFVGSYSLIRSANQDFENDWMAHIRYNHELSNLFRMEAFIQSQENRLLVVDSRNLIGGGIRLKILSTGKMRGYWGSSYMYEIEGSSTAEKTNYNHRHSTYLSTSFNLINGKLKLINTVYYQPLYRQISNFRILEQFKVEIPLHKKLRFSGLFNYFYMSRTPLNRSDEAANISFGVTWNI